MRTTPRRKYTPLALALLLSAALALLAGPARRSAAAPGKANDRGLTLFREQIRPVLTAKCLTCHNPERKKGRLDLSRRETALATLSPGNLPKSKLHRKLADGEMPPQNPLPPEQVAAFRQWIEAGAPYEGEPLQPAVRRAGADWWSLQPIRRPVPPAVKNPDWCRTPIDRFILAKLEAAGLDPAPEADRRTLIRRATFDVTGLPPTPEAVDAFVNDPSPDAYEKLIDRLLASPAYGERWGRHWLDVVRFAESHGYETNQLRFNAWPYRDWVIRAFNEDMPFPRFVREQLAGDTLRDGDWLTQAATGFLVGGAHDVVGNQTPEGALQQRMDDLDDMITATGAAFLGLTVNCARCHDHKFDPINQRDYYGLQAVFAGVQHAERPVKTPEAERRQRQAAAARAELARVERRLDETEPLARTAGEGGPQRPPVNPRRNVDRFAPTEARFVRFTALATNDGIEPCIDELEIFTAEAMPRNVAPAGKATASSEFPNAAIHKIVHVNDGRYGNGRSWISNERGKGWVQIELPRAEKIDRVVWGRDREEKFRDRLATTYRIEAATEPGKWRLVASSADRQPYRPGSPTPNPTGPRAELLKKQAELQGLVAAANPTMPVYAGIFSQPGPTHLLLRGDPMRKGDEVAPRGIAVVRPPLHLDPKAPEADRRLALARWIAHPDNPLPARVMVNRAWHYHFGQGIVATPSDFGYNGARPTHPELLDWLAGEFMASGGCQPPDVASGVVDPRRAWRLKPLHRMILLSATYRQDGRMSDRAMSVDRNNHLLWRRTPRRLEAEAIRDSILAASGKLDRRMGGPGYNLWEKNTNYVTVFRPKAELGPEEFRRMVYQFKPRTQQDPTFGVFDCPDAALARPRRESSTTVLQALNLLNGRLIVQQADYFAERLRREAGDDPERQVELAFRLAFGRPPTGRERSAAAALVRQHGTAALCRAVYNANEFVYVD